MKILFVQLPLQGHGHEYIQGNVPYAPAVMSAYCEKHLGFHVCTEVLPQVLADFGSDSIIARYIEKTGPDVVCFTGYLWNVERNIVIAGMVRHILKNVRIIMGGPEISSGSWALSGYRPDIDFFVSGEGEWFLSRFCRGLSFDDCRQLINGNKVVSQPVNELIAADDIPEPFSANRLQPMVDNSIFMELTRGCPYRCSYCFYSRNCSSVRELSFKYLLDAIDKGRDTLREIYILSPTFNTSKNFHEKLESLAALNHGIRLHTEMKAGGINPHDARLLYRAGFRSLEVGLQTLNPGALREVGRAGDPRKEIEGMKNLRDAGIDLKIGIIPGLPGDSPVEFHRTIDILCNEGLGDFLELYPLMILPGTAIRERADRDNVRFQELPPYYYLGGWGIDENDILEIEYHITEKTGFRPGVFLLPSFIIERQGLFCRGMELPADCDFRSIIPDVIQSIETYVFSFYYHGEGPLHRASFTKLFHSAGTGLIHHVFFRDNALDENFLASLAAESEKESLQKRLNIFHNPIEGWRHRITQVFTDAGCFFHAREEYTAIEPVLKLGPGNVNALDACDPEIDSLLVTDVIYQKIKRKLLTAYGDYPERLAFEREEFYEDFFRSLDLEWIRYPYSFFVKDYRR